MPDTPVPPVKDDATVLGMHDYEMKYKEAPPLLPDPVPSSPLPPAVLCHTTCHRKLNIKYGFEDNVNMASDNMAAAYDQLDPKTKLKIIQFPNSPCCFNIATSKENSIVA
eukprot:9979786-Ditylum_brightwellii.AAC.1